MIQPVYDQGGITLYCADARDVLPQFVTGSVGITLTDPPYEAEAHTKGRRIHNPRTGEIREAPLTFAPMTPALREFVSRDIARVTRRWSLVFCQIEAAMTWRRCLEDGGARYMRTMVWVKPNGQPQLTGDRPGMGYETIVVCHATGASRWNGGGQRGWFEYAVDANFSRFPRLHQTQKPMPFIRELVRLFSDPDEVILDPFAGSGTTLLAARTEGRRAIGIEISEPDCETIIRRLERGEVGVREPAQQAMPLWETAEARPPR